MRHLFIAQGIVLKGLVHNVEEHVALIIALAVRHGLPDLIAGESEDWPLLTLQRQVQVARSLGLGGQAYFRARFLLDNVKGLYDWLAADFYSRAALVPPMTWLRSTPPAAPQPQQSWQGQRLTLQWLDVQHVPVARHA